MPSKEVSPRENEMTCEEVTYLVHEFLDHELPEPRHTAVREHVESCPACWRKFEFEKELQSVIWEQGQSTEAPSYILDRIRRNLFDPERETRTKQRLWPWAAPKLSWGWGAAILILMSIGLAWIVFFDGLTTTPLVAELVGDHIQYASAERPSELISSNAEEVETWLEGKLGYAIDVPHFEGPELHLVGGRLLKLRGRKIAYLIYRDGTHVLSLYVTRISYTDLCADNRLQLQDCRLCLANIQNCEICLTKHSNHNVLSWHEDDVTYAMVSDLDSDHMLGVTCPQHIPG